MTGSPPKGLGPLSSIHSISPGSSLANGSKRVRVNIFHINDPNDRMKFEEIYTKALFQRDGYRMLREPKEFFSTKTDVITVYFEWEEPG